MCLRKFIFSCILFSVINNCAGQQYNNWYFGKKAGLSFNNPGLSGPAVLYNGAMSVAYSGTSAISDTAGSLLFYTDGITVYNRNHFVMQNGNGLAGQIDGGAQNCIIIQQPGSDNLFYIFTTNTYEDDPGRGYHYSIVDMARDNGNGAVITKNILLSSTATERLTAARHADGINVWLITNSRCSNTFEVWLINCNGLQPNPVVSKAGEVLGSCYTVGGTIYADATVDGMMKVSPDGKQLCQTQGGDAFDSLRFFQLFDFDNTSGTIFNPRKIFYDNEHTRHFEYSPDSKYLYITRYKLFSQSEPVHYSIDQLEAKLSTETAIIASKVRVDSCLGSTCVIDITSLQSAPDGKIYLARGYNRLSVINYPNIKGLGCKLQLEKIDLTRSSSVLPNMINDAAFDPYNNFTATVIDSCNGRVQFNGQTAMPGAIQWLWDFGDGTTSNLQNPQHNF
ncbi:MAG: PKD domain-containing protein, partial [Bacteroidetes bacterium]|nr:PKD domain-containing protein [Bacteroidota bacterium]